MVKLLFPGESEWSEPARKKQSDDHRMEAYHEEGLFARDGGGDKNASDACRGMSISKDTFYRIRTAHATKGIEGLKEEMRHKTNL